MATAESETRTVSFTETGEYLESVRGCQDRRSQDFLGAILRDLHHGELPELLQDPDLFFNPVTVNAQNRYGRPIQQLEWFEGSGIELQFMFGDGLPQGGSPLELDFDLVWMDLEIQTDRTIRVAPSAMRGLRSEMVTTLYDERPSVGRGVFEERCVLLVTIDGPAYKTPELTVLGPSRRARRAEGEEGSYSVNVVHFPFDDLADERSRAADFTDRLNSHLSALARRGDGWKDAFKSSVETLSKARNRFRKKLREELQKTMTLLEQTHQSALEDELNLLRQAASLVAYRTMFLQELERRGRLYRGSPSPARLGNQEISRSLADELAYRVDGEERDTVNGALVARLVHTVRAIRGDIDDESIAITGASIFDNRHPNFDAGIGTWLDSIEALVDTGNDADLLRQWDERIRKLGSVMLGHLDDEYRHEVNLIGEGAHRHRHRVLGSIYEQILAMTPKRGENGKIKLVRPEDDDDDDRSSLGAHYTPIDLVEEVVRPTLGQLFRQYWDDSDGDVSKYCEQIREMTIVDPAMGSAHFLTVAALEVARELAWLKFFDRPRFEVIEDWDEPLNHRNSIGRDPQTKASDPDEVEEVHEEKGEDGGQRTRGASEDQFYKPEHHDEFVEEVRSELSGVVRRSIYGVDKNALATELSKLSLWLFEVGEVNSNGSLTEYPELTYLDANIRCGDSVVGVFLDDVQETVDNALRSSNSFEGRQQTMMGLMNQTETVQEKLDRAKRYRRALQELPEDLNSFDPENLDPEVRDEIDLSGVSSGYDLQRRIDEALRRYLAELEWVFDLTLVIRYLGYTAGSGTGRAGRLYRVLFEDEPPGDSTSDIKPPIEKALLKLFEEPESNEAMSYRNNLAEWLDDRDDLDPFHWEVEFPSCFLGGGFDSVVANPPFIGDRDLRGRLGSKELVELLANYFIPQKNKSDYSGFFFWRYDQIVNESGVVGSLASNSLAQGSNRVYITKPLASQSTSKFFIFRAIPNRNWPGEAKVHFAAIYLSRHKANQPRIAKPDFATEGHAERAQAVDRISSYLDEYPDFNLRALISSDKIIFKGFNVRGANNKPFDLAKPLNFLDEVPEEEYDALTAAMTTESIQQNPSPRAEKVVIDYFEPLYKSGKLSTDPDEQEEWIRERYPRTFDSIQGMKEHRSNLEGDGYERLRKFWWRFDADASELRHALRGRQRAVFFGETMKVWSPSFVNLVDEHTGLRVGPTHMVYVAPMESKSRLAVLQSFLIEMIVRRQCSSLKSDLRFTPTNVFPFFPWPWNPSVEVHQLTIGHPPMEIKERLTAAIDDLLEIRTEILENPDAHGLNRDTIGGPTDLYNLYDADPTEAGSPIGARSDAIEELREAHVDLLNAVLRAYGWEDIADDLGRKDWTFDRPWLDRTQRFVPPEPVRAELFQRIDKLNTERFEQEREMMIDIIVDCLPEEGITKTDFSNKEPFSQMSIDADQFEAFMEHEHEKKGQSRVRKDGYRWKAM